MISMNLFCHNFNYFRDQVAKLQTEHRKLEEANYILEGRLEEFNIQVTSTGDKYRKSR